MSDPNERVLERAVDSEEPEVEGHQLAVQGAEEVADDDQDGEPDVEGHRYPLGRGHGGRRRPYAPIPPASDGVPGGTPERDGS
ncbi:MAG: hypothetical protein M3Q71_14135 [Chloroflexota bacterium]|nr:hypothetical protein [Chloroflexota bacterium]MDP9471778.1 hypothetical protein [Chloroflexota bacterium]